MWVDVLNRKNVIPEAVEDAVAQKLEASGHWRRASARWLSIMGDLNYTEAQREWLLLRREYCRAKISPPMPPEKLDVHEIAKAADATLIRMGLSHRTG
ncbi:PerC family transcriptional regulator [Escherichia coli]|nr:PerC family transcriptional regulator [Escherichia coli]EJG6375969.1 PerC family transcriptional regulator [Escherichia coli]EJT9074429.1 PerC family transcriptional regulator [Escherichia coli]ELH4750536.1 PerC family transcriptional regulator [Escherichia coli]